MVTFKFSQATTWARVYIHYQVYSPRDLHFMDEKAGFTMERDVLPLNYDNMVRS